MERESLKYPECAGSISGGRVAMKIDKEKSYLFEIKALQREIEVLLAERSDEDVNVDRIIEFYN